MSRPSMWGWFRKRSRWARWALGSCALLAMIVAAAWFATPWYLRTWLLPRLWEQYGLTVTAERRDLSVAGGAAEFHGLRVFDGEEEVLTAKRAEVRVSLRGLYAGRTVFERVVFDDPVLQLRLAADGRTNVGRILERRTGNQAAPRPATLWQQVTVHRGTVEWDDRTQGVSHRILDVDVAVLDMQTGRGEHQDRFGQITLDASLEQPGREPALLSIVHWATPSGSRGPTFVAHAALTGIDLDSFPAYVDTTQRASLGVNHLDLVVSMDVHDGVIRRGAAVAMSPERRRPLTLLFGGPFDDPVFDRSSRLVALSELPFSRLGRVGDVVWETGGAVVGGAVGIIDGVVHGDLLAAGTSAVEGVGGGALALGSNALDALDALGRALGLVAQEKARDSAAIHERQRSQFLAARREASQTWSRARSEPGGSAAPSPQSSSTLDDAKHDHDERDDQKKMDHSTHRVGAEQTSKPQDDQNDRDGFQHSYLLRPGPGTDTDSAEYAEYVPHVVEPSARRASIPSAFVLPGAGLTHDDMLITSELPV